MTTRNRELSDSDYEDLKSVFLATYEMALDSGKSVEDAAQEAATNTIDTFVTERGFSFDAVMLAMPEVTG